MPQFDVTFEGPDGDVESVTVTFDEPAEDLDDDKIEEEARHLLYTMVDEPDDWDLDLISRSD